MGDIGANIYLEICQQSVLNLIFYIRQSLLLLSYLLGLRYLYYFFLSETKFQNLVRQVGC